MTYDEAKLEVADIGKATDELENAKVPRHETRATVAALRERLEALDALIVAHMETMDDRP